MAPIFEGDSDGRLLGDYRGAGFLLAGVQQAVMRRLLLLLALAGASVGVAHAQNGSDQHADQGAAYAHCMSSANQRVRDWQASNPAGEARIGQYTCSELRMNSGTGALYGFYERIEYRPSLGAGQYGNHQYADFLAHTFPVGKDCSSRTGDGDGPPPNPNAISIAGAPPRCHNGCAYERTGGGGDVTYNFGGDAILFSPGGSWQATGGTCSEETPPQPPEICQQIGNLTQCLKNDGRHCAVSTSGKQFCFQPGEAGTKVSGNEASTVSPVGVEVNPPPVPPKNNGSWQPGGSGTTTIINNGSTTINNVTNHVSNYGPTGSGGGAEPGTGGGNGNGNGNGGEGEGEGHGTVGGDGSCQGSFSCTGGDPVLCAMAQQTYLARCEAEGRLGGDAGPFPGDGDGGAGDDPEPEDARRTVTMGLGMLDDGGFLGGGQCPDFGSVTVMGKTIELDPQGRWCDIIGVARACLLLLGAFIALGILVGRTDA